MKIQTWNIGENLKSKRVKKERYKFLEIVPVLFIPLLVAFVSIRGWELDFTVPIGIGGGDGGLISTLLKSIEENGIRGAFFNNRLGTSLSGGGGCIN